MVQYIKIKIFYEILKVNFQNNYENANRKIEFPSREIKENLKRKKNMNFQKVPLKIKFFLGLHILHYVITHNVKKL